ncbi:restriction endonuclease subunit S [Acinetobacter pittii]|uniref:restriction endonuclease subunit S n=1 Tax=Acinetobacter pittii TaxID=48296 RepID=UPI00300AEC72
MAKYQKYAEYKDTGIKLLGEVPKHWQVASVRRYLLDHRQGYYTTESYVDDGLKLLRITDLRDLGEIDILNCPMVKQNESTDLFKLKKGDVVFARTGGAGSFGVITKNYENLIYASYLIRFRFMDVKFESNYLRYLCLSDSFQLSVKQNIHGGVNQNIHAEDIKDTVICTPPLLEQNQITKFLDQETAKINLLIAKQEKLIELLKEKRQAVISQAVTKGLNPNVPMKDSGVEWLGEVPEHWETPKMLYITTRIGDGLHSTPIYQDGTGYYFINGNNLVDGEIVITDTAKEVPESEFIKHQVTLDKSTVLLSINGTIGKVALYNNESVILGKSAAYINCHSELLPSYLASYLTTSEARNYYDLEVTGTTIFNLSLSSIRNMRVPLPSINEQAEIVQFITKQYLRYESLIQSADKQNKLLKERRTALISAAVTGKIDVRYWQNNNQNNKELSA